MFYVYVYKDPRPTKNLQVVYVGKGVGDRMYAHWKKRVHKNKAFGNFLSLLRRTGLEPIIEKVSEFEDEADAFVEEMRLIALYGRRDVRTGSLFNLTDGGEGFSGVVRTEEWTANHKAAYNTPESRAREAEKMKRLWADPEYRANTTAAVRKALQDPEVIARREAGKSAFVHTEEFRDTMRAATTKLWGSPEYAEKVKARQREAQGAPEQRAKKSENSKRLWQEKGGKIAAGIQSARAKPESRAKTSAASKQMWADPKYAAEQTVRNREIAARDDVRAAKKAAAKALWSDPEWRAKMLAARAAKKAQRHTSQPSPPEDNLYDARHAQQPSV